MPYNPLIHKRKSIRLKGYDYTREGMYFITICCYRQQHFFGEIINNEMALNELGQIAHDEWQKLPQRFKNMEMGVFQIMPNHMHGIVVLHNGRIMPDVRASLADALSKRAGASPARTDAPAIGNIIGAYKSLSANKCLEIFKMKNEAMGKLWHRNYYEHIIRNEKSYHRISEYVLNNPTKWSEDKFFK